MDGVRSGVECAECELAGPGGGNYPSLRMVFFPVGPTGPPNELDGPCTWPTVSASGTPDGSPIPRMCWHSGWGALVSGR